MIYLNRTGFNGLYRVNKQGKFNVPFGKYTNPTICDKNTLKICSKALQNTKILYGGFEGVLEHATDEDFVYIDPPYFPRSKTSNFSAYTPGGFKIEDHERLAALFIELSDNNIKCMLSNSDVEWVRKAYADFNEYRLPTSHEWEKAARGPNGQPYPFEGKPSPQNANYHHSKDPFDVSNGTTPVGFYNGRVQGDFQTVDSPSPYGCYDMAGNVSEWLGELHKGSHLRLFYGGSMMDYGYNLRSFTENSGLPQYASFQVGFRCVR